jgi:hypothetical protein
VQFNQDIDECGFVATVGKRDTTYFAPRQIQAILGTGSSSEDDVYVAISTEQTGAVAQGFTVVAIC